MLKLSKDTIKKLAIDDMVYSRGIRYFKNGAVSNVTWSNKLKQYRATVTGKNPYSVTLFLKEDGTIEYNCNCPDHAKRNFGACKHIIAALLFINDYMERAEGNKRIGEEKTVFNILEYFNKLDYKELYGETFDIKPIFTIPELLQKDGKVNLAIRVGNNRMYKVQNLKRFILDYKNNIPISLGKEFRFIPGESRFSRRSKGMLDYLLEVFEIQEYLTKTYSSTLFAKSDMILTKRMFGKLLEETKGEPFTLILNEVVYDNVIFSKENPDIRFHISAQEDEIFLDYNSPSDISSLAVDGSFLLYDHVVYMPEKNFIRNLLPFYKVLGKEKESLIFKGSDKQRFLDLVLPKIHETMEIDIPDKLKENYIVEDMVVHIYLDRYKNYIKANVKFHYGEYEINPLAVEIPNGIVIVRQKEKEEEVFNWLEDFHFYPQKDSFLLKDEDEIYFFITDGVKKLSEQFQVYYSEDFKGIRMTSAGSFSTAVRVNNDINMLELDLEYENVPKEELRDLFHSLQLKKKYYRLKNGSFINLEGKEAKNSLSILQELNLTYLDLKEEHFSLPQYTSLYLNELLDEMDEEIEVKKDTSFRDMLKDITDLESKKYTVPKNVQAKLRKYQKTGYCWLKTLAEHNLGGVLADDMGLGKTLESIVYLLSCPKKLHLIVCPTSLVYNWMDEIQTFAPSLRVCIINGTPENRQRLLQDAANIDVLITSYPLLRRDFGLYQSLELDTIFIDEAQFIKNPGSQNAKSVKRITAKHKFALTGTPIENSLSELWSIFDFILPGYLLSHNKFVQQYEKPIVRDSDEVIMKKLSLRIQPFILRRMKKDVLKELPEKIETKLVTELTEKQNMIYLSYLSSVREELWESVEENGFEKSKMQILSALTRLRQICCHPSTFVENYSGGSGKLDLLMEQIPTILENGHRILLFSQFTSMLKLIGKELKKQDISYFYLDGATKSEERIEMVNHFNSGERQVFLVSLKAGGTGINLTGADTVIHYDPWWNPAVEEQATDRVYRIGQKNTVHVIKLLTKGTIEEKIYKLQKKKKELSDSVISAKEVFINRLSRKEIEELFLE